MALDELDNVALVAAGKNFSGFFATLAFQTFFYGIYVVLFLAVIVVHYRRRTIGRAARVMFLIIIGMFITTTIYYATSTTSMVSQIRTVLVDQQFNDISLRLGVLGDLEIPYNILSNWVSAINFCASDAVVVWRAWAFSAGDRRAAIPSIVLLFLTFVSAGIFVGYSSVTGNPATSPPLWAVIWAADQLAMETLSLLTNISATVVIGLKARNLRKLAHISSQYQNIHTSAQKILLLFLESGLVYIFIQAILVILTYLFRFTPDDPVAANAIRSALGGYFGTFTILSGIYPTLIVFVVAIQQSTTPSNSCGSMSDSTTALNSKGFYQSNSSTHMTSSTMKDDKDFEPSSPMYYPYVNPDAKPAPASVHVVNLSQTEQQFPLERSNSVVSGTEWDMVVPHHYPTTTNLRSFQTGSGSVSSNNGSKIDLETGVQVTGVSTWSPPESIRPLPATPSRKSSLAASNHSRSASGGSGSTATPSPPLPLIR